MNDPLKQASEHVKDTALSLLPINMISILIFLPREGRKGKKKVSYLSGWV